MSVLAEIVRGVVEDQKSRELSRPQLDELLDQATPALDSLDALRSRPLSLIAEVKRSSPSKGLLAEIANPEELAKRYESAGAGVVSVLTEQRRFGGSLADLIKVRASVKIPVLRKDFVVNEYLVRESRAYGADLLLLIVAALDDALLKDLYQLSSELGMKTLVEIHSADELERALALSPEIIGVNSRNLKTLEIDLANFELLLPQIPVGTLKVAESGIGSVQDVIRAVAAGADAILVGESLVKAGNPEQAISEFLNVAKTK